MYALIIEHQTQPGRREEVETIWRRLMLPAVAANDGHVAYVYSFGQAPDSIVAVQVYRSVEDAEAFIASAPYLAYVEQSRGLLERDAKVTVLDARWIKGVSA